MNANWNLQVDYYKWIGIVNGRLVGDRFLPKEELDPTAEFTGYLRIENDYEYTIEYRTAEGFNSTYA
jgi:hypothetical protein